MLVAPGYPNPLYTIYFGAAFILPLAFVTGKTCYRPQGLSYEQQGRLAGNFRYKPLKFTTDTIVKQSQKWLEITDKIMPETPIFALL